MISKDPSEEKESAPCTHRMGNKAGYHRVIQTTSLLFSTQIIGCESMLCLNLPLQDRCSSSLDGSS